MKRMRQCLLPGWFVLLCVILLIGCDDDENIPGHDCEYIEIPGTAVITSVREPEPELNNCANAVEIQFAFEPDDLAARERYLWPEWDDVGYISVGDGKNPPKMWAASHGLMEGQVHRCIRAELTECCPCNPVIFAFPDADFSGWEDECFDR